MLKDEYKVYEEKMKKSIESVANDFAAVRAGPVSYTHLEVYKRQLRSCAPC